MTNKIDWIKSQLLPKESASNAASRLNTTITIENPSPIQEIPAPIDMNGLRAEIDDLEAYNVLISPLWDRITTAIAARDLIVVNNHVKALLAAGLISMQTVAKMAVFMSKTIPDPNYQSTIETTIAEQAGFDLIYVHEVQEAIDSV